MAEVVRQEKKYLITQSQRIQLQHQFSILIKSDPHNESNGYRVRSLYFDTLNDRDFQEKEDGVERRRKLRLRVYNPQDDFALLEVKQKEGAYQRKRSVKLTRRQAEALIQGYPEVLLECSDPFAAECYGMIRVQLYQPKTIVEYQRFALIGSENSIRITFDHQIRATEGCFHLFDPKLSLVPVFPMAQAVLEVKFNHFLPSYIQRVIQVCDRSELSVSKYTLARRISHSVVF